MIEILPAPDHVAAYRLVGKVSGEDFDKLIEDLDARLQRHVSIGIYVDLRAFDDMSAEAALKDMSYGLGKLGDLKRFQREAIVTDKQWIRAFVRLTDPLLPFVELRTFAPDEAGAAMTWAAEAPAPKS